jgi:hypothetical protein
MTEKPDFEKLRAKRNAAVQEVVKSFAKAHGWDTSQVQSTFDPAACYCACPEGPCEHDWQGWRDFEDGSGGETVCARCGMGAMSHSLRTAE